MKRTAALAGIMAAVLTSLAPAAVAADAVIGRVDDVTAAKDDTFLDIGRAHGLGFTELRIANPDVDPWVPRVGSKIVLPTAHVLPDAPRRGIVINLADQRLYRFDPKGNVTATYPIGIGREGHGTPSGRTSVVRKQADPPWYPPASVRADKPHLPEVVPAGPDNPLGRHALYLGWPAYVIHGTNVPAGIGRRVSYGCIRLFPKDIAALFGTVEAGTPVTVVDQPVKLGWRDDTLYLEVHPSQTEAAMAELGEPLEGPGLLEETKQAIVAAQRARRRLIIVDWAKVREEVAARRGIPVAISRPLAGADNEEGPTPSADPSPTLGNDSGAATSG